MKLRNFKTTLRKRPLPAVQLRNHYADLGEYLHYGYMQGRAGQAIAYSGHTSRLVATALADTDQKSLPPGVKAEIRDDWLYLKRGQHSVKLRRTTGAHLRAALRKLWAGTLPVGR